MCHGCMVDGRTSAGAFVNGENEWLQILLNARTDRQTENVKQGEKENVMFLRNYRLSNTENGAAEMQEEKKGSSA